FVGGGYFAVEGDALLAQPAHRACEFFAVFRAARLQNGDVNLDSGGGITHTPQQEIYVLICHTLIGKAKLIQPHLREYFYAFARAHLWLADSRRYFLPAAGAPSRAGLVNWAWSATDCTMLAETEQPNFLP